MRATYHQQPWRNSDKSSTDLQNPMSNNHPLMSRRSAPFRDRRKNDAYRAAATRAYNGEFGTRQARVMSTPQATLFWTGYDGNDTDISKEETDFIYFKLGQDVRKNDDKVEIQSQYQVNGKRLTQYQREIYDATPESWVSAERISQQAGGDSKSVGAALMVLARRGLLERRPTTPPYYRRKP